MKILILGGTSGMGLALARHYLLLGHRVSVCGRDIARLQGADLHAHPQFKCFAVDIANPTSLEAVMESVAKDGLDLMIVTAGVYFNSRTHLLDPASTLQLLQTNVTGLSNALNLGARHMLAQGHGQMVAVSSIAGLMNDYPGASVYSASKRTVLSLCDTYRKALAPFGIAVTAIVPGYVDTQKLRALNGGDASHKPFLMSEAQAVQRIADALSQRSAVAVFPWQLHFATKLMNYVPIWPWVRHLWEARTQKGKSTPRC